MKKNFLSFMVLNVVLFNSSLLVFSEEPLSLDEVRKLALENSYTVINSTIAVENSELDRTSTLTSFYPDLSLEGSVGIPYPSIKDGTTSDPSAAYGISLTQQLFTGGSRWAELKQSSLAITKAKVDLFSVRNQVLETVDGLYLDVLEKSDKREVASQELEAARLQLETTKAQYELGTTDRVSYLQVESKYRTKRAAFLQSEYDLKVSKNTLATAIGRKGNIEVKPVDSFFLEGEKESGLSEPVGDEQLLQWIQGISSYAREVNPDLRSLEVALYMQDTTVQKQKASLYPTLSFSWSHSFSSPLEDMAEYTDSGKLSVSISVPLFPYQDKKASIGKAENERIVLGAQLNEQQRKVEAGIEEYVFGIISATEQRNSAESSLLYAEENYRQVYEKYRLSKATLLDVSEAESLLSDARYQLLSARYSLYKYCFGLKYLLGFEDDGKFKEFLSTQG